MAILSSPDIIESVKKWIHAFAKSNFIAYLYLPASLIYLEVVLFSLAGHIQNPLNTVAMVFVSFATGTVMNLLSSLSKRMRLNAWIAWLLLEITTILFMLFYFVQNTYMNYVNIATVVGGAGGVLTEFGSTIIGIVTHNWTTILLFEAPAILLLFLGPIFRVLRFQKNKPRAYAALLILFAVFELCGAALSVRNRDNRVKLLAEYDFNTVVRCFNLETGLKLDLIYLAFGNPTEDVFVDEGEKPAQTAEAARYGTNSMEFDFSKLASQAADPRQKQVEEYLASQQPSAKNKYTGLFRGKNLIFITAESMSKEMIEEDTMPTLFHMMHSGIVFEDYYQPYWNGSTSTGEFANLLGLIPTKAMASYEETIGKNLYFTMGNELDRLGYFSRAYHNGTVEYYDRYLVHPNFGYEQFIADGNGMEKGLSGGWPISDLEMIQYALPQFQTKTPFNVYFMSITGHFPYFRDLSVMVEKYGDRTKDKGYSDVIDAYICSQIDLDEAVSCLIDELKKDGTLEDTVFVIAPDHYPYGLTKNDAWGTDRNYLPELYGFTPTNMAERDHNALIIWSPVLDQMEPAVVSDPSYSVDILPTLLNLYGIPFDSRLLAGRDCLSDAEGLVIWPDYSWVTSRGTYLALENRFIPAEDAEPVDEEYLQKMKAIVRNKMTFSTSVLDLDYYNRLFPR